MSQGAERGGVGWDGGVLAKPLRSLRSRARGLLVTERVGVLVAWAVGGVVVVGLLDWMLRLPVWVRGVGLAAGVGVVVWWVWRVLWPALRFCPRLTDVALRVEGAEPGLRGRLASGLEFAGWGAGADAEVGADHGVGATGLALARRSAEAMASRVGEVRAVSLLRGGRAGRGVVLALAGVVVVGGIAWVSPASAKTGAARVLMPWAGAAWPKRTGVADRTGVELAARGEAVTLRALAWRRGGVSAEEDVRVEWRAVADAGADGGGGAVVSEFMTWQGSASRLMGEGGSRAGVAGGVPARASADAGVFERPVRADAGAIEYRFVTSDDATVWRRVRLEARPRVVGASARLVPPAYAGGVGAAREVELGAGNDERAFAPSQLAGTSASLRLRANKASSARFVIEREGGGAGDGEVLREVREVRVEAGGAGTGGGFGAALDLELSGLIRVGVTLEDGVGLASRGRAVYRFEGEPDRAPVATVIEPARDLTVLATAVVGFAGEARDDVGLSMLGVEARVWRPEGAGSGARVTLAPVDGGAVLMSRAFSERERSARVGGELGLASLLGGAGVEAGDQVRLEAVASDIRVGVVEGVEPARSRARVLRVVDESAFVEGVRSSLNEVRESVKRIDRAQEEVSREAREDGATGAVRREQREIGGRVSAQREAIEAVRERVAMNRLEDARLEALLDAAEGALERAEGASERAGEALSRAAASEDESEQSAEERERAEDAQREVREALAEVVARLDSGDDDWVVRNRLERALEQQRELRERTEEIGRETAGRDADMLSEEQRAALDELAREQQELAERTEALVEETLERAAELEESDPVTSRGLEESARAAQRRDASGAMQRAAEQAGENRTNEAQQQQRQAEEALEEALERLDEGERARSEVLRRILASVEETLEGLVAAQRDELAALSDAVERGADIGGLAGGMIALNRNTLSAADLLRGGGARLLGPGNFVARALEAQEEAIVALRRGDAAGAERAERRSLLELEAALNAVRQLDEQIEDEQQRRLLEELRRAYVGHLEEAVRIGGGVAEVSARVAENDGRVGRRERAAMRGLARELDGLTEGLGVTGAQAGAIEGAFVVEFAHARVERGVGGAAERLRADAAGRAEEPLERAIVTLRGIVEALGTPEGAEDRPFEGGGAGGGGGGGGGAGGEGQPAVPPAQQLRLLRAIQLDLAERTRVLDGLANDDAARREGVREVSREQRELSRVGERLMEQVMGAGNLPDLFPDRPEGGGGEGGGDGGGEGGGDGDGANPGDGANNGGDGGGEGVGG